jgi:hypothetical protein
MAAMHKMEEDLLHREPSMVEIITILRNPYGFSDECVRKVRLAAAEYIDCTLRFVTDLNNLSGK